jgi:hypothetical protein
MSSTLYWRIHAPPKGKPIGEYPLKEKLRKKFGDGRSGDPTVLGESALEYLRGLDDCGVKGADTLIEAIEQHGAVEVWEEF